MEELVSARISFFSQWPVVQAIFIELCMHFFNGYSCFMIFFYCKGIAGDVFSNLPPPPPVKDQMVHPLVHLPAVRTVQVAIKVILLT